MPTIHTSRKLEKLIKKHIVEDAKGDSGRALDSFYAEVITIFRKRYWIVIHEPSLYCVILPNMTGTRVANAGQVLAKAVEEQFRFEGIVDLKGDIPSALKVGLLDPEANIQLAPTNANRKTTGYLRDRIDNLKARVHDYPSVESYSVEYESGKLNRIPSFSPEDKSKLVQGHSLMCEHLGVETENWIQMDKAFPGEVESKVVTKEKRYAADMAYYDALEASTEVDFRQNLLRALKLNPKHIPTRLIFSESLPVAKRIFKLEEILKDAKEELGKGFVRYTGAFWGFHETRPFMRVKAALAGVMMEEGVVDVAISHWQEMMELNPEDNQGIRYLLAASYLRENRLQDFQQLYAKFVDEQSGHWAWFRVFYGVLGGEHASRLAPLVEDAEKKNSYVMALLKAGQPPKVEMPAHYMLGSEEEALIIMRDVWGLLKHPKMQKWVKPY